MLKFQAYNVETLLHSGFKSSAEPEIEWLRKCELSEEDFIDLKRLCDILGITFLATPESLEWATFLAEIGVPAFKISSLNIDNYRLLEHIARFDKPIILSTGMAYIDEIYPALEKFGNCKYALLHCVSQYPADFNSVNLKAIKALKKAFSCPVGFSDHTVAGYASMHAIPAGADIIEVHITYDSAAKGPDHNFSLSMDILKDYVFMLRSIERMLGNGIKAPHESEIAGGYVQQKRRCCVAYKDIKVGEEFLPGSITCLCPGDEGVVSAAEYQKLTGGSYIALEDIKKGTPIYKKAVGRKQCPRKF